MKSRPQYMTGNLSIKFYKKTLDMDSFKDYQTNEANYKNKLKVN